MTETERITNEIYDRHMRDTELIDYARSINEYPLPNLVMEKREMFATWLDLFKTFYGWALFAALCWAAIYKLVKW